MQLCFDNTIDWADGNALGGIEVAFAFNAGGLVDHIEGAVAFGDGFRGAIRYAGTAGDAVILDFHGHGIFSFSKFEIFLV